MSDRQPPYDGLSTQSRQESRGFACSCGERFAVRVWRVVDAVVDGDAAAGLLAGHLNFVTCPLCGAHWQVQASVVYHDAEGELLALVLPDGLRHREMEERALLCRRIADDGRAAPRYVREFHVAFGAGELEALARPVPLRQVRKGDAASTTPVEREAAAVTATFDGAITLRNLPVVAGPSSPSVHMTPTPAQTPTPAPTLSAMLTQAPPTPMQMQVTPTPTQAPTPAPPSTTMGRTGARVESGEPDPDETRVQRGAPDARAAAVERWIANREGPAALLCGDEVIVCAALPPVDRALYSEGELELRMQLHRMPDYPLLVVTLVSGRDRTRAIHALLEIGRAAHRVVLDRLGKTCSVSLELFDEERSPVVLRTLYAPLEDNVRHLFVEAKEALQALRPAQRSFERARLAFQAADYDRIGRVEVDLSDVKAGKGESLRALRRAVAVAARWSDGAAERYLVEIRSVPLQGWRTLREEVVRRAIERGIHIPRVLGERVLAEAGVQATWAEVLRTQVAAFHACSLGQRDNDLILEEEAENWQKLVDECAAAGVELDAAALELAERRRGQAKAERRRTAEAAHGTVVDAQLGAGSNAQAGPPRRRTRSYATTGLFPVELREMSLADLVALLDRKELRREAALVLCERRDPVAIGAIFGALPEMTRTEVNHVLPQLVSHFGERTAPLLVEGLRSRRSYLRQGCALGIGALRASVGAGPLVTLLLDEPTEIWAEAARAIGDLGVAAVEPLVLGLRRARAELRERVVHALAHLAGRTPPTGGRLAVERLTTHADAPVREAATRALDRADEVGRGDALVRSGGHASAESVAHAFTRRFYEALGGEELSDDDLEEVPDDGDAAGELDVVEEHEATATREQGPRPPNARR